MTIGTIGARWRLWTDDRALFCGALGDL